MIKINQNEAMALIKMGVPWRENGISHTVSTRKKTYYLAETRENIKKLNNIRGIH